MANRWVTPDKRVIDYIDLKYPGSGSKAGPQFRLRDIYKHYLGTAYSVEELKEKFDIDLATLEEI
jgi:hypothetical protein